MSQHNGRVPEPIDPAVAMKAQMAMALRQVEAQFPGCAVTVFIADPADPSQFSYVTSAPVDALRRTAHTFMEESGGWAV